MPTRRSAASARGVQFVGVQFVGVLFVGGRLGVAVETHRTTEIRVVEQAVDLQIGVADRRVGNDPEFHDPHPLEQVQHGRFS